MKLEFRRWPFVASAAAAILAFFFVTRIVSPVPAGGISDPFAQEVLDSHLRSLLPGHLVDMESPDANAVRPWFNGRLDYSPPVSSFADQGYVLAGGRLDVLGGRSVAALIYYRGRHVINLYVWPEPRSQDTGSSSASRQGYNLLHWDHAGMNWWMASDLNAIELETFAKLLRRGGS